jgi:hypothetical protein
MHTARCKPPAGNGLDLVGEGGRSGEGGDSKGSTRRGAGARYSGRVGKAAVDPQLVMYFTAVIGERHRERIGLPAAALSPLLARP